MYFNIIYKNVYFNLLFLETRWCVLPSSHKILGLYTSTFNNYIEIGKRRRGQLSERYT